MGSRVKFLRSALQNLHVTLVTLFPNEYKKCILIYKSESDNQKLYM